MDAKPTNICLNAPEDHTKFGNILRLVVQHILAQHLLQVSKQHLSNIANCNICLL